ncbi:hypothetical protein LC605_22835 [Nostoc sp. CHAB 5836]|uniref:hypothetical protein n=1 Tax=Nostoc sp. CHAB 5836 TaxID=2780404 RepID=UPI001E55A8D3|nr:hypothetical protein [Nostoc sp. CHAB 5836]MCC5617866.1 hypothetical protein [Nostoc sp. CHAB 5836]
MLEGIKYVSFDDVREMLDGLSQEEKEALLSEQMKKLSAEAKARVLGLSESGLTIVTGSFASLNSDVAINIQNASGFEPEALLKALVEFRKAERESK